MAPGRSAGSSRDFFSGGPSLDKRVGDDLFVGTVPVAVEPMTGVGVVVTAAVVGFFRPLRDGGGGASSVRPCERKFALYVFTVFGLLSRLRISIEMEAFLLAIGDSFWAAMASDFSSTLSPRGFLGILGSLLTDGDETFGWLSLSFSLSLSLLEELLDLSLSLCSRCLSLELLFELLDDFDEDELLCLLLLLLL